MISKPTKYKLTPLWFQVIVVSAVAHLILLIVLGGLTIFRYAESSAVQFEEAPQEVVVEVPKDMNVAIQPQRSIPRHSNQPLRIREISNIAVPAVNVEMPAMKESFTVGADSGQSIGGSLRGMGDGRVGLGMSDVRVFGLTSQAERVLFLIDASRDMVVDAKGGLHSYQVIKDEINDMVGNLSPGTLYNVILYDRRRVDFFRPRLVAATPRNHTALVDWMSGVNARAETAGLQSGRRLSLETFPDSELQESLVQRGGREPENMALAQLALEQKVDAVFIITGYHRGFGTVSREYTEAQRRQNQAGRQDPAWLAATEARRAEEPEMRRRIAAELARINERRKAQGLPPRVLSDRMGLGAQAAELGLEFKTPSPGNPPNQVGRNRFEEHEVQRYFRELIVTLYSDHGGTRPTVNVVLFLSGDEELRDDWEADLRRFTQFFRGRHRVIRGLNEIRSSRTNSPP